MNTSNFFIQVILSIVILPNDSGIHQTQNNDVKITVIFDNYTDFENLQSNWGFSCLIEGKDKTILFDAGTKPEIFRTNIEKLEVLLHSVDLVVISHNHGDHTGGLPILTSKGIDIPVYVPVTVQNEFKKSFPELEANVVGVSTPVKLCEGVYLTGELGDRINEQALVVETSRGWVVITGCSHPGIAKILDWTANLQQRPIYLVMGGFHMLDQTQSEIESVIDQFRNHQVIQCAATHCTGDEAVRLFHEAFQENFLRLGAGKIISIPDREIR